MLKYIQFILVLTLGFTSCQNRSKYSIEDSLLVGVNFHEEPIKEVYKAYEIHDTLSLNVLNNPFSLDSTYKFIFYLDDFLLYEGKYKDDIVIYIPYFEEGKSITPYFKIIDPIEPNVSYSSGFKDFINWREGAREINLVFLPDSKKVKGGAVFFTSFYNIAGSP